MKPGARRMRPRPAAPVLACPSIACGIRWGQTVVFGGAGVLVVQHRCERCRTWYAIGYRVALRPLPRVHLVGIVRSAGEGLSGLRLTLPQLDGFTPAEQDLLLSMAEAFGLGETSSRGSGAPSPSQQEES